MTNRTSHRVLFVGDIVPNAMRRPPDAVRRLIESFGADSAVGNCEISLTDRGVPAPKFVTWRTAPSAASTLRWLGFDVVSLANNHMLDYGREGLADTLAALRIAGVRTIGAGVDLPEAAAAAVVGSGDRPRVACLGVACTLPLGSSAGIDRPGVQPIRVATSYEFDPLDLQEEPGCQPTRIHTRPDAEDLDRVCQRIRDLKSDGQSVVISIHWGNAFQKQLAAYQRVLAQAFADAGCDAVIGHHPHTPHAIERIGVAPVFYSLGNFLIDAAILRHADRALPIGLATPWVMSDDALVAVIDFASDGPERVEVHPIHLDSNGDPARLERVDAEAVLRGIEALPPGPPPWTIADGRAIVSGY